MNKKIGIFSLLLTAAFLFSGCNLLTIDNSEIMRPPHATGDKEAIQNIIDVNAGDNYTLKYPQGGDYRSAIIMHDITGDTEEEALAIYRTSGEEQTTHIILMDEKDGEWVLTGDFTSQSPEVSRIVFADINADGTSEILVGFSTYSTVLSSLAVYTYDGEVSQNIEVDETFTNFIVGDFSGNGSREIMLLSLFNNDISANAKLLCYDKDNNSIYSRVGVNMDSDITHFINITYGVISDGVFGVFVDGQSVDSNFNTQIIYFNQTTGQLENSMSVCIGDNKSMHRTGNIISSDIDSDGIIEVPITEKMTYDEDTEVAETVASKIVYYKYDINSKMFNAFQSMIYNSQFGYTLNIMPEWEGKVTARIDNSLSSMSIYSLKTDSVTGMVTSERNKLMLTIKAIDINKWVQDGENGGFLLITKTDTYAYAYKISPFSDIEVDEQDILNSFVTSST